MNMQNIPSRNGDIRRMFRASPGYVMMSSDYSQQEPKLTAYISGDAKMIDTFKSGRDIYATIASAAYGVSYEDCLEFHPETHEYQPDGKAKRGVGKVLVLGKPSVYAPLAEVLPIGLLSENFVNPITQGCISHFYSSRSN